MAKKSLLSPPGIASYAFVFRKQPAMNPSQEAKYSITLLIDKDEDLGPLKKACLTVAEAKFGAKAKDLIRRNALRMPFRDGDEEKPDDPNYRNRVFISAKTSTRPGVVDTDLNEIIDESDFYSGCVCRISLVPFAYDTAGNKGVSFALNNVQKLDDGERLSGRPNPEDEFGDADRKSSSDYDDDDIPY